MNDYRITILRTNLFEISLLDFVSVSLQISEDIRNHAQDFREKLIRRFPNTNQKSHRWKWTIELFHSEMLDELIQFNQNLSSPSKSHYLMFICLDRSLRSDEEIRLKCSYLNSIQIPFTENNERIFQCLEKRNIPQNKLNPYYPLIFDINHWSTGLVFNYYFGYLNRQIGSTNNIYLTLIFNENYSLERFPSEIFLRLKTSIEVEFLSNIPSTFQNEYFQRMESKILQLNLDQSKCRNSDRDQMIITYSLISTLDFGLITKSIEIYQDLPYLNHLISIQLKDDVRKWNERYKLSKLNHFKHRRHPSRKCLLFPKDRCPNLSQGFNGVSTMKKTTKDCFQSYIKDEQNHLDSTGQKIHEIKLIPVYYLFLPLSCQFGPSDINENCQSDSMILRGTIIDPFVQDRIQLARVHRDVLRSERMEQLNRYLRRTFYYFDHRNENNEIIRYLFCGEYPNIASTLNQLEKIHRITSSEKSDEYSRFCNILYRLIHLNDLPDCIQLIQYNDQIDQSYADFKPPCEQIKEHMDEYYSPSLNHSINLTIVPANENSRILLFYSDQSMDDPSVSILINDIKAKLRNRDLILEDIQSNLIEDQRDERTLFICTGKKNEKINRLIINSTEKKMKKFGVLRDVFILVNEAIEHFPCRFIRSIAYLTFDLHKRSPHLDENDIETIISYLTNMNVSTRSYQINFDPTEKSSLYCPNIGQSCGVAFYFNYVKTIISSSDHRYRMEVIENQIEKEQMKDLNYQFIFKWIFLIPKFFQKIDQILPLFLSEENSLFKFEVWKSKDKHFRAPDLTITIGGVFQRSFSPLIIYKLTNFIHRKSFYFSMEIPAALNALERQYNDIPSHFHFGRYDPEKQAAAFQKIVKECFEKEEDQLFNEHIRFLYLDNSQRNDNFLQVLWETLSSSPENNSS